MAIEVAPYRSTQLGRAVEHLLTRPDKDGGGPGSWTRQYWSTRRRGSTAERPDRVEIIDEVTAVLGLQVERWLAESDDGQAGKSGVPGRVDGITMAPALHDQAAAPAKGHADNPFALEDRDFVMQLAAADMYQPRLEVFRCDLEVHRTVCVHHTECRCHISRYPDPAGLFEGIPKADECQTVDEVEVAAEQRRRAIIDKILIGIYVRHARREQEGWQRRRRAWVKMRRAQGLPGGRKPIHLLARDAWQLGACDRCGGDVTKGMPVVVDRDLGERWHEGCGDVAA